MALSLAAATLLAACGSSSSASASATKSAAPTRASGSSVVASSVPIKVGVMTEISPQAPGFILGVKVQSWQSQSHPGINIAK